MGLVGGDEPVDLFHDSKKLPGQTPTGEPQRSRTRGIEERKSEERDEQPDDYLVSSLTEYIYSVKGFFGRKIEKILNLSDFPWAAVGTTAETGGLARLCVVKSRFWRAKTAMPMCATLPHPDGCDGFCILEFM